jgi:hypothetical protein
LRLDSGKSSEQCNDKCAAIGNLPRILFQHAGASLCFLIAKWSLRNGRKIIVQRQS